MGEMWGELFIPKTTQLALFFAPGNAFKAISLAKAISEDLSSVFSVEPNVVSYPPEAPIPPEVPRIILQQNSVGQLAIAFSRADLTLDWKGSSEWQNAVVGTSRALAQSLIQKGNLKIQRIGLVLTSLLSDSVTIENLRSRYIPSKMEGALELRFAWLRRIKTKDLEVNRWVQFFLAGGTRNVMIDINTRPEDELNLNPDSIEELVKIWLEQIWGDIRKVFTGKLLQNLLISTETKWPLMNLKTRAQTHI